jgi:hypothetical protein
MLEIDKIKPDKLDQAIVPKLQNAIIIKILNILMFELYYNYSNQIVF